MKSNQYFYQNFQFIKEQRIYGLNWNKSKKKRQFYIFIAFKLLFLILIILISNLIKDINKFSNNKIKFSSLNKNI